MTDQDADVEPDSRRLAAILFADIVGYANLMGRDESGTVHRVSRLISDRIDPLVQRWRGRIVKQMGDGMLVEFFSAVDAVEAALEWQEAGMDLCFRIGIEVGDIITRDGDVFGNGVIIASRLEQAAPAGGTCISGRVLDHVRGRVDIAARDLGTLHLKNVKSAVRGFAVSRRRAAAADFLPREGAHDQMPLDLPPVPIVAVLPFVNMSPDPDQTFFADGLSEDIITNLSYLRGVRVISRTSSFAYRDRALSVTDVASQLAAGYVLEGSVRTAGERLRVTCQLVDGATGAHIWAEKYDRNVADIFAVQDEITLAIVTAMQVQLSDGEMTFAPGGTENHAAWVAFHQGVEAHLEYTRESNLKARRLYKRAAELDRDFIDAKVFLAWTYWQHARSGFAADRPADLAECRRMIDALTAEGVQNASLDHLRAAQLLLEGNHEAALEQARKAVLAGPSRLFAYTPSAVVMIYSGHHEEAVKVLRSSIRSLPAMPGDVIYNLIMASLLSGAHDRAVDLAREYRRRVPHDLFADIMMALAYGCAGDDEGAASVIDRFKVIYPDYGLRDFAGHEPFRDRAALDGILDTLHRAGLPE